MASEWLDGSQHYIQESDGLDFTPPGISPSEVVLSSWLPTPLSDNQMDLISQGAFRWISALQHVTQMDLSDLETRLLSEGLDRGAHIQMDLSAWAYPKKQGIYSDARSNIPGVTTVKQSGEGPPLSATYSDARCQIPGVTKDKQNWEGTLYRIF